MIRKTHLPPDATLLQIAGDLAEPEEYLRRVLGNMRFCQKRHGDALLRIGVTGKSAVGKGGLGKAGLGKGGRNKGGRSKDDGGWLTPSYRIDYHADGVETVFNGFGGTSHSAFTETNVRETNWSRGHATIQEVQRLYDDLRKGPLRAGPAKEKSSQEQAEGSPQAADHD